MLRKRFAEEGINWVEALPRVLRVYHDLVGESGYSPHEALFGRPRNLSGLPYILEKECEDAQQFFDKMELLDKRIALHLDRLHQKRVDHTTAKH